MSWIGGTRPITITEPQVLMVPRTLVAVLALHFFLTRSRLGKAMRAMADNADLAQVSGINTALVVRVTWIIAGALACMAGTMLALDVSLKPDLAFNIILPIFAAAVVGGLGPDLWRHRGRLPRRLCRDAGGVRLGGSAPAVQRTSCRTGCGAASGLASCPPSTSSRSPSSSS